MMIHPRPGRQPTILITIITLSGGAHTHPQRSPLAVALYANRDRYFLGENSIFVHVGKTGGSTLDKRLRQCCNPKHGKMRVVHMTPLKLVDHNQSIVVSIREPVARTVSAFNYRRHKNAMANYHCSKLRDAYGKWVEQQTPQDRAVLPHHPFKDTPEHKPKNEKHHIHCTPPERAPPIETALFACYANVNEFAEALYDDPAITTTQNHTCRDIALEILDKQEHHIGKGFSFYLNTAVNFTAIQHRLFAVRTEHLDADFCLYAFLRAGGTFDESEGAQRVRHCITSHEADLHERAAYPRKNETALSKIGMRNLRRALAKEYAIYDVLANGLVTSWTSLFQQQPP